MLLNEFLKARNQSIVSQPVDRGTTPAASVQPKQSPEVSFAEELKAHLESNSQVQFSNHAIKRLESREIDVMNSDTLERLNKGVELAAQKGCGQSLILVDSNAYIVSVANNRVITTISQADLMENVFTNIDSTVIV